MKNKNFIAAILIFSVFFFGFIITKNFFTTKNDSFSGGNVQTINSSANQVQSIVPLDSNLLVKPNSPFKGPDSAKVVLVEFLDPECEACAATYPYVKRLFEEFQKDLKIVVRYMPYHRNSKYVANILEGIRSEGKYWEALELLFATQDQWASHHNPKPELIPEILAPLGLNLDKILREAKEGRYNQIVELDYADGKAVGVQGTPSFFLNGQKIHKLDFDELRSEIVKKIEN